MKNNIEDVLMYVVSQISSKNYIILSDYMADGLVYKIPLVGNLKEEGYEMGYLYLPVSSGIKEHMHINNTVERYRLINGELKVNGNSELVNICDLEDSHSVDKVEKPTLIEYCKVNRVIFGKQEKLSNEDFDLFIKNVILADDDKSKVKVLKY